MNWLSAFLFVLTGGKVPDGVALDNDGVGKVPDGVSVSLTQK